LAGGRRASSAREPLPSKEELRSFLAAFETRPRTNELLRAFGLRAGARGDLRRLLQELEEEGAVPRRGGKKGRREREGRLPNVTVIEVVEVDENGDLVCRARQDRSARILLPLENLDGKAPDIGDQILARLEPVRERRYEARLIKLLPGTPKEVVGVLEPADDGLRLRPSDRAARMEFRIAHGDAGDAAAGDLVRARVRSERPLALPRAAVVERLGRADEPSAISLASAVQAGLPMAFSDEALAQAEKAQPVRLGRRRDLRDLDLVTIDGEDARDFDDAVWATPDTAKGNPGGFRIVVAIADVAHYVKPGTALDENARERGNSVYFPDRVIPMLPEKLSNDLCSLRPDEDRACIAALMRVDRHGKLIEHNFVRGLMRSRARLTYTQVQAAKDGAPDDLTRPLLASVIEPLYAAYEVLAEARRRRGTIELDLPERKVLFDEEGGIAGIAKRERMASHMLIEEFMILANVAAATLLEEVVQPGLYRVHDKPDPAKLDVLADYLERIGVPWSRTAKRPGDFTELLERLKDHELKEAVSGFVLRSQAQAVYSPRNIGHFGLHLRRYAHFTSPIRRYSDLVVHRAIIKIQGLGRDGLGEGVGMDELAQLGQHLSQTERRAMEAERRTLEKFVALYLSARAGATFKGKVTGTQHFGLFVTLDETGAEGLVPVSMLGDDAFIYDQRHHALVGQRWGETFGLGDPVTVELVEADAVTGSLVLRLLEHERAHGAELARRAWGKGAARRPPSRRRPPARRR
jgi:ribonuclease R